MKTLTEAYLQVYNEEYALKHRTTKSMGTAIHAINKGIFGYIPTTPKFVKFAEAFVDNPESFPPSELLIKAGWPANDSYTGLMDITMLMAGEFDILVPAPNVTYNTRQIGRALMQMIESYSESENYIGVKEFPQTLAAFTAMAQFLRDEGFISSISKDIRQLKGFSYIFGDAAPILQSFNDIQKLA